MNTIKKSQIIEADKLATLYAGELRGKGYTPRNISAVTPDKVMRLEFQNGVLSKAVLPVGKMADWVKNFPAERGDVEIEVQFESHEQNQAGVSAVVFNAGGSRIKFLSGANAETVSALSEVPAIRFDDDGGKRLAFELVKPAGLENLSASLKADKALKEYTRAREAAAKALQDLRTVATGHCANLATLAGGIAPAIAQARLIVKARRMLRRVLANPQGVIEWLGESITPAGEYDAGPQINLTPEHTELVTGIATAEAARNEFYKSKRCKIGGPKWKMLTTEMERATGRLFDFICREHRAEMEKNGLPALFAYSRDGRVEISGGSERPFSRARLAVAGYGAKKWFFAQDYIRALNHRRKTERKAVAAEAIVIARATLPNGETKGRKWCAVENLPAQLEKAAALGAVVEILESNVPAYPVGIVGQPASDGWRIEHQPKKSALAGKVSNDWYCLFEHDTLRAAGSLSHCEGWKGRILANRSAGKPDNALPAIESALETVAEIVSEIPAVESQPAKATAGGVTLESAPTTCGGKTYRFENGKLSLLGWSFSAPDNDPPHRHSVLAECTLAGGQKIKLSSNLTSKVWWLTGTGNGFAGDGCSRVINSLCTRNANTFAVWKTAIETGNVEIVETLNFASPASQPSAGGSDERQTGFARFQFGFADVGEVFTCETTGVQLRFVGNFKRRKNAMAAKNSMLGKNPACNGYLNGKFARGWVVWETIGSPHFAKPEPQGWATPLPAGNFGELCRDVSRAAKLAGVKPLAAELPEPAKPFVIASALPDLRVTVNTAGIVTAYEVLSVAGGTWTRGTILRGAKLEALRAVFEDLTFEVIEPVKVETAFADEAQPEPVTIKTAPQAYRFKWQPWRDSKCGWHVEPGFTAYHTDATALELVREWNQKDKFNRVWTCEICTADSFDHPARTAAPVVRKDEAGQVINGTFREVSGPVILPPIPPRKGGALASFIEAGEKLAALMAGENSPAPAWSGCAVY